MKAAASTQLDPICIWKPVKLTDAQKQALAQGEFVVIATQRGFSAATLRNGNAAVPLYPSSQKKCLGLRSLANLDAHHRLVLASLVGAAVFVHLLGRVHDATRFIATWNGFALTDVFLAWCTILRSDPDRIRRMAQRQDVSTTIMFTVVIIAASISLLAVGFLLGPAKGVAQENLTSHLAVSVVAVVSSWYLVHTVFALRYAHLFYLASKHKPQVEGLTFPGEQEPDYVDFAYFAFIIGMTFQVSDVQVTSRKMRQLVLLHGVLAFAFNTVILALSVSVISQILSLDSLAR
ncbi:MAG: DUF1345 domain-containing protein [Gammaproteobacteria bacterium]